VLVAVLFSAGVALLARSFWRADLLAVLTPAGRLQAAASWRGSAIFFFSEASFGEEKGVTAEFSSAPAKDFEKVDALLHDKPALKWAFAGFRLARGNLPLGRIAGAYTAVTVPQWVFVLAAAIPTWRGGRRLYLRRRRARRGLCVDCGYDLRGTPGRCPECGLQPA